MTTILITGGTGLIGKQLITKLIDQNYIVRILTRTPKKENEFSWNISSNFIDEKAFENLDYIIHLAGAGIADKRWTKKRKQEIIDSRTKSATLLLQKVKELNISLKGFVSASAIGFYGAITSDIVFTEKDKPANDFLGNVCQLWENSALEFEKANISTTILRTGIVLTKNGGALQKMKTPIITPLGNGKQFVPWIHIDDLCSLYLKAITDKNFTGIYNAVAPEHQTNKSFSKTLASHFKKPYLPIGIPAFLLKLFLGEMAVILLKGSKVSSEKIQSKKYIFTHQNLNKALQSFS